MITIVTAARIHDETALMARRLTVLLALLAYAALTLGSGLDRLAAKEPGLAHFVPSAFAAEAHRAMAARALRSGKVEALTAAQGAVAADPIDPHSAALLGGSSLLSGQPQQADRAFRVAAQLGWRDPLTQLYFMNQALRSGNADLAALRLDALLRQNPLLPVRDMVLSQFEASSQGRNALSRRVALRPPVDQRIYGQGGPAAAFGHANPRSDSSKCPRQALGLRCGRAPGHKPCERRRCRGSETFVDRALPGCVAGCCRSVLCAVVRAAPRNPV